MLKFVDEDLVVIDGESLKKKLNFTVKHYNKLPNNNKYIKQVVDKFHSQYSYRYIVEKMKVFYWTSCETEIELEQELKNRLNANLTFNTFFS